MSAGMCLYFIEPCQSTPTIYTIEAGQDKVTFFPEHGNCYNLKTITKNFCKGDCGGDVCTEISPKRRMYDLKCTGETCYYILRN